MEKWKSGNYIIAELGGFGGTHPWVQGLAPAEGCEATN